MAAIHVSKTTVHKALEAAQLADAVIYAIVVMPITNEAGRQYRREHAPRNSWPKAPAVAASFQPLAPTSIRHSPPSSPNCAPVPAWGLSRKMSVDQRPLINWSVRALRPDLRVSARKRLLYKGRSRVTPVPRIDRINRIPERQLSNRSK